jgi:Met-zincin/Domain of unknown function (DUF5117)/Domain of unknown function (DUF5118)
MSSFVRPLSLRDFRHSTAFRLASPALISAMAALIAGCATPGGPTTPAAPVAAAAPAATAPAAPTAAASAAPGAPTAAAGARPTPPTPGAPPAFADVTKDASSSAGFLTVWTKDDKTWLEIPVDKLNQLMFFGSSLAAGLGERGFWPGLTGRQQVVLLRRVGNSVQLVARNFQNRAPDGSPLSRAVAESYSDSLIAAVPLAAAPHPERKSLLVDANALLAGDIPGAQTQLENAYRMPYAHDRANSSIERVRTSATATNITARLHYSVPKLPAFPVFAPGAPPPPPGSLPNPPVVVPDARSLFLSYTYSLTPMPAPAMAARRADQRVGFFTEAYAELGNDVGGDTRSHLIRRWRLEKADPSAAVSAPKEPIRVVMDRNIPEKWRAAVKSGITEWNKAFEKAGWRDAITVEQQANDADWSSLEGTRILAVRWFAMEGPGATAVGPSQADPRSGEILRGAAIIPENWARFERLRLGDVQLPTPPSIGHGHSHGLGDADFCSYGADALQEASTGFELLNLRGEIDPQGPQADAFIAQALKDVTMHEVGHAIGLRHNFRASVGITRAQLRDAKFTAANGVSNSVMDYNALNMPLVGEATADYQMTTLGAYDYWAIEYGYREFAAGTETKGLADITARSERELALAYATDEDVQGIDPLINQRDLGDDPLAHAGRQIKLARELWTRTQSRVLPADDNMAILRRNLQRGLTGLGASVPVVAKYVGGTYTSRALAGAQQPLLTPVPAAKQREALDLLVGEVFASNSFRFDPKFMSRLGVDQLDRIGPNRFVTSTDFSLSEAVLGIQRGALDALMSDGMATRLADAESKVADPRSLLSYADVQARLSSATWSELKAGKGSTRDIDSLRRNLQREHLRRIAGGLIRPASAAATDVRAVYRQVAQQLQSELKGALSSGGWSSIARAHLADSMNTLDEALRAPLMKQGV